MSDGSLALTISDDGDGDPEAIAPGRGIMGMRERAGVHGGVVTLGQSQTGGIEVEADLKWKPTR
jgi:signal transduction histidine kinase